VAGTYRLRLWNEALTGFSPIQRLLGIDREGTLYIGTSKDLPNRIGTLKKAVCAAYSEHEGYKDPTAHGVGRMMSKLFTDTFVFERLCVELQTYPPVEGDEFYYYAEEWLIYLLQRSRRKDVEHAPNTPKAQTTSGDTDRPVPDKLDHVPNM
jgi:hypothetical protein